MQVSTESKKISRIPPKLQLNQRTSRKTKKLRVAAYCRVSTEHEDQENSYEAQIEYYTQLINENDDWVLAGIYADDGKSATNTKKRDDFNAMVEDALNGKIDMIITKSVSRFARNTVDSLQTIRKLKERNIPVIFEKENVNTLDGKGELLITILSSLAQEESRNISENVKWGIIRKFEQGKVIVNHNKFMGYTKDENGTLVIVPEEAEVVKLVFRLYLEGYSIKKIADYLTANEIKTATGLKVWHDSVVLQMLKNEKYMGDALLQKTYTVDFITKKKVVNHGIVPQYYVEDDHEAIIPKQLFYKVQEEMARRSALYSKDGKKNKKKGYSSSYALTGKLICSECGQEFRHVIWTQNGKKRNVWRCGNRLDHGKKHCKSSKTIDEAVLNEAVMKAICQIVQNDGEFVDAFRQNVIRIIGSYGEVKDNETDIYEETIQKKQEEMVLLIEENAKLGSCTEEFDAQYRRIAEEIAELKGKQNEYKRRKRLAYNYEQRVQEMDDFLQARTTQIPEFDDDLVRRLIDNIQVVSNEMLIIHFQSGITIKQMIADEVAAEKERRKWEAKESRKSG